MRKKPDILLLLTVLVVSGVIISNFLVFKQDNKADRIALLKKPFSQFQADNSGTKAFSLRDIARIDSSKQQIR